MDVATDVVISIQLKLTRAGDGEVAGGGERAVENGIDTILIDHDVIELKAGCAEVDDACLAASRVAEAIEHEGSRAGEAACRRGRRLGSVH